MELCQVIFFKCRSPYSQLVIDVAAVAEYYCEKSCGLFLVSPFDERFCIVVFYAWMRLCVGRGAIG